MARIAGVDLPKEKRIEAALTYIFGIGFTSSRKILEEAGVDPNTRVNKISAEDVAKLNFLMNIFTSEFIAGYTQEEHDDFLQQRPSAESHFKQFIDGADGAFQILRFKTSVYRMDMIINKLDNAIAAESSKQAQHCFH